MVGPLAEFYSSLQEATEEELERLLDKIMVLFRFIHGECHSAWVDLYTGTSYFLFHSLFFFFIIKGITEMD